MSVVQFILVPLAQTTDKTSVAVVKFLAAVVVIVPTLAPLLASAWLVLAFMTSSKWMTSQRRATTWGHHVGCLRAPSAADAVRAGVCDWRTGV